MSVAYKKVQECYCNSKLHVFVYQDILLIC